MKEEISALVYSKFYELLRQKFFDQLKNSSLKVTSKEIWKENYPNTKSNIAEDLFKITNPLYFLRKYDEESKQHVEVGYPLYPVTIERRYFVLGLEYLLNGINRKLIDSVPSEVSGATDSKLWADLYQNLLKKFVTLNFPEGIAAAADEIKKVHGIGNLDEEQLISKIISDKNFFQPKIFQTLVSQFFDNIASQKYANAWNMLTIEFRNNSIWLGSLDNFIRTYKGVSNIILYNDPPKLQDLAFRFKQVTFLVQYLEDGNVSNFPWKIVDADEKTKVELIYDTLSSKEIKRRKNFQILNEYKLKLKLGRAHHNWLPNPAAENIIKMDNKNLMNADFHKLLSIVLPNNYRTRSLIQMKYYIATYVSRFTCKQVGGLWLIDSIRSNSWLNLGIRHPGLPVDWKKIQ